MGYILTSLTALLVVVISLGSEPVTGSKWSDVICSEGQNFIPNKFNCGQFYQCSYGNGILKSCPIGLYFNPMTKNCDWPFYVDAAECSQVRPPYQEKNTNDDNETLPEIVYTREVGKLSLNLSSSISTARCPEGTVPVDCACSSPGKCNGAKISNLKCIVYSLNGEETEQKAVVTCLTELSTAEFRWVQNGDLTSNPVAACPAEYQIFKCLLFNPWSSRRYVFTKMDVELNQCETDGRCDAGLGCQIQAICRKTKQQPSLA